LKQSGNSIQSFPLPELIIAERDVPVAIRDGVKLSINIFRPEDAGKYPVIMGCTPYGKDISPDEDTNRCRVFNLHFQPLITCSDPIASED
jgi:predicted acyl esterase